MANRYWVGGTGTWDASSTTHWSTTSGGSGGASVPGSADTAIFNASSGAGSVTLSSAPGINSLDSSASSVTMGGTVTIASSGGSVVLGTGVFLTINGGVSTTLTSNGNSVPSLTINGTLTCTDALTSATPTLGTAGTLTLKSGATSVVGNLNWPASGNATLQSSLAGTQATLSDSSGTNTVEYTSVKDIAFTGGATWVWGTGSTDNGNNTGISYASSSATNYLFHGDVA